MEGLKEIRVRLLGSFPAFDGDIEKTLFIPIQGFRRPLRIFEIEVSWSAMAGGIDNDENMPFVLKRVVSGGRVHHRPLLLAG